MLPPRIWDEVDTAVSPIRTVLQSLPDIMTSTCKAQQCSNLNIQDKPGGRPDRLLRHRGQVGRHAHGGGKVRQELVAQIVN